MPLLHLPNELLCCISENLESERDINALAQANRRLYRQLNTYLYHFNIQHSGSSALLWAAQQGQDATAQKLLEASADDQVTSGCFKTALCKAAEKGHKEIVKLLLDKGVDVNALGIDITDNGVPEHSVEFSGVLALEEASYEGHTEVVQLLLDRGANVNAQSTYFHFKQEEFIRSNALYAASSRGHEQIVKLLLNKGADVHMQGGERGNALVAASRCGHKQVVELLLDKGADVNAQHGGRFYFKWWSEFLDSNALYEASETGSDQVVKLLLDRGADINMQGGQYGNVLVGAAAGIGPLMASGRNSQQVIELLLAKGADVNTPGKSPVQDYGVYFEISALQATSENYNKPMVQWLLDKGAARLSNEILSRTMTATFEYCRKADIPINLSR